MLKSVTFENFRSFRNRTTIEIKPITLLVGPNSSGKSSILSILGLVNQSYSSGRTGRLLKLDGPIVNLGGSGEFFTRGVGDVKSRLELLFDATHTLVDTFDGATMVIPREGWLKVEITIAQCFTSVVFKCDAGESSVSYESDNPEAPEFSDDYWSSLKVVRGEYRSVLKTGLTLTERSSGIRPRPSMDDVETPHTVFNACWSAGLSDFAERFVRVYRPGQSVESVHKIISRFITRGLAELLPMGISQSGLLVDATWLKNVDFPWGEFGEYRVNEDNPFKSILQRQNFRANPDIDQSLTGNERAGLAAAAIAEKLRGMPETPDEGHMLQVLTWFANECLFAYVERKKGEVDRLINNVVKVTLSASLKSNTFVKPLRAEPKRFYTLQELGESLFPSILTSSYDMNRMEKLLRTISGRLKEIGIDYDVNIDQLRVGNILQDLFSISVVDCSTGATFFLPEVGFGVSQVLPIIAASEDLRDLGPFNYPIVVVEQPELHLHPRIQARLASVFRIGLLRLESKKGAENALNNTRFVIETHSEHLVRGFQVLVAKGLMNPNDVVIYYVSKDSAGRSSVRSMQMDERGFFSEPWPEGFFDQAYLQSMELIAGKN
jgi:energy-coupling factor transporter ATP-binding protein EcfA2